MIRPPKIDPKMRKAENLSMREISKKYPGMQFNSPQAQRELKMSLKRNYTAAGFPEMAQEVENNYRLQGSTKKASIAGAIARTGLGALAGGYMGYRHGDAASDGSTKSRLGGAIAGALTGGAVGLGMHGLRALGGAGAAFNKATASNALLGLTGLGAAAGAGHLGSKVLQKNQPDLYRPDYVTDLERRQNADIQELVAQLKAAGGHFDRMDPNSAVRLRSLMADPTTNTRVMSAYRAGPASASQKTASFMQMYAHGPDGTRTLVPYNDPRAIQMAQSVAFQDQLKKRIALMQLQRMQQIQALSQTLTPDYRDQYANQLTQAYLAGALQRPQQQPQQPTEEQARNMINQYMSATGVDTDSSKARKAADKYDGTPPAKAKSKQNPVRIKAEKKMDKSASLSLKDISQLEKIAGSQYPTIIDADGTITKEVNGTKLSFDRYGQAKIAGMPSLAALKNYGKYGLGAAALGGLGYGGYKLHEYLNRDTRTTGEKLYDAGKAALPSLIQSYKAYQAMKNQVAAAQAGASAAPEVGPPAAAMQPQMDPRLAALTPEQRAQLIHMQQQQQQAQMSQFDPMQQPMGEGYREIY